ncbi:ATP-binding protein [Bacillus sp. E(2018)]|uniref:DEAD/DEAH box helicase n=1 Tax=Bacillus sp. E(2018) TaxID=2502239 RepID=UPI00148516D7|nr:ATP-binding protein [Bacillus sp. E(2018)]
MRSERELDILNAWHKIEYLNPMVVHTDFKKRIASEKDIPWNGLERSKTYVVYLGVCNVEESILAVKNALNETKEDYDEINYKKKTAFGLIKVDKEGNYVKDSLSLSSMPFAVGKLINHKNDYSNWHHSFKERQEEIIQLTNSIFEDESKVTLDKLLKLITVIQEKMGWFPTLHEKPFWFKEIGIKHTNNPTREEEILNSFYARDLERTMDYMKNNKPGKALQAYLSGDRIPASERKNIDKDKELLSQVLSPGYIPNAKWPSNDSHKLSLMQQAAVNLVNRNLGDKNGIFSVNGPPGTGKTTLLKDIIANIITERAQKLITYDDPTTAFQKLKVIELSPRFRVHINRLDENLQGYGIVVASSNNKAVENISKELPQEKEIDKEYRLHSGATYFQDMAQSYSSKKNDRWGLFTAPLGNRSNIDNFFNIFWGEKESSGYSFKDFHNKMTDKSKEERMEDWKKAINAFHVAEKNVKKHQERAMESYMLIEEQRKVHLEKRQLETEVEKTSHVKVETEKNRFINKENLLQYEKEMLELKEHMSILKEDKYTIWQVLLRGYKENKHKKNKLQTKMNLLKEKIKIQSLEIEVANHQIENLSRKYNELSHKIMIVTDKLSSIDSRINEEKSKRIIVDQEFWELKNEKRQLAAPWVTDEYTKARAQLFLEAMNVHEKFIIASIEKVYGNLKLFDQFSNLDLLSHKDVIQPIWDVFTLVVPVISTTFASFSSLFRGLEAESLGWLFIDEAGQAVPQAAVGAIWRAQKVVVVGDPKQIEPVVTQPESLFYEITKAFSISSQFTSKESSVQSLADMANVYGTYLGEDHPLWIGSPLWVHRRCANPMFSICNKISYENQMVLPKESDKKYKGIGPNQWFDVKGKAVTKHFVKEQGDLAIELLKKAFEELNVDQKFPSVFIISPFVSVKDGIKNLLKNKLYVFTQNTSITQKEYEEWVSESIGTVHTFQGKEADIVIIVLGVDSDDRGAARWATDKANIINVAVSRAKKNLYVIGDKQVWAGLENAKQMLEEITKYERITEEQKT